MPNVFRLIGKTSAFLTLSRLPKKISHDRKFKDCAGFGDINERSITLKILYNLNAEGSDTCKRARGVSKMHITAKKSESDSQGSGKARLRPLINHEMDTIRFVRVTKLARSSGRRDISLVNGG